MTVPLNADLDKNSVTTPLLPKTASHVANGSSQARTELHGLSLMAFSTVGYSVMAVLVRMAEKMHGFPPFSSVLLRGIIHVSLSGYLAFAVFKVSPLNLPWHQRRLLLLRGVIGAVGMLCLFSALNYIPAGEVISIFAFSPILTMVLSRVVLTEHIHTVDGLCAILGLIGVFLIAQKGEAETSHWLGCFLAFCGACAASTGYVCVRSMGTNVHFMLSVFSLSTFCVIGAAGLGQKEAMQPLLTNRSGAFVIVLASVCAFLGQSCLNKGLQLCHAGPGTIMRNLDVPIVYLLGIALLGEKPTVVRLSGSVLVVLASVLVGIRKLLHG